jgi:uncharacterized protein
VDVVSARDEPVIGGPGLGTASADRVVGIDVTRGVALIGVVVMNYHGYLNGTDAMGAKNWAGRLFNPWIGVLSTRFAATFVTVAGIGITLLTRRSVASGDDEAVGVDRWRLRRRGLLLLAVGYVFDWIWAGSILPFYGLYFLIASFMFTWRARSLIISGSTAALLSAGLQVWNQQRLLDGRAELWFLGEPTGGGMRSPRNLATELLLRGTHPLVPWLAFLVMGMLLGRALRDFDRLRRRLIAAGLALLAGGYAISTITRLATADSDSRLATHLRHVTLTDPFARSLLYVMTALGSSLVAVMVITWLVDRWRTSTPVDVLRRAGQMSLSLYVLHALVFNVVVDLGHWVGGTGLDTALVFSAVFWVLAVGLAAWWHRFVGQGPAERVYRRFGG